MPGGDLKGTVDGYRTTHSSRDPERFLNWSSVANLENSSARNMEEAKAQKRRQQKREQSTGGYIPKGAAFRNNWDQRRSTLNPTWRIKGSQYVWNILGWKDFNLTNKGMHTYNGNVN